MSVPPPLARSESEAYRSLIRDASERHAHGLFVIEGPHLLERAIQEASASVLDVCITREAIEKFPALLASIDKRNVSVRLLTTRQSEQISDTRSPQGIYARVRMPRIKHTTSGVILLDGVQDPGNVGTIIRSAAWFGFDRIILANQCADPFSPKTIRATQGEIFTVGCEISKDVSESISVLKKKGYKILTTTLDTDACSIYKETFDQKSVFVFGSEAHGVSAVVVSMSDRSIMIPKYGSGESLNVAMSVAIILSEVASRTISDVERP